MLVHILTCLQHLNAGTVQLLCVDAFDGVVPFHGLGQLSPAQLASLCGRQAPVTEEQFDYAGTVNKAFATQDTTLFAELAEQPEAPLPWVPAAITRWLQEQPDPDSGLGRLESLALDAIRNGCETPANIFKTVASADTPPQFWGDITL